MYNACDDCHSKLVDGNCLKCNKPPQSPENAAIMKIITQEANGNIETLTMFSAEVEKISAISLFLIFNMYFRLF